MFDTIVLAKKMLPASAAASLKSRLVAKLGYDVEHWCRTIYLEEWRTVFANLPQRQMDTLEVSPGNSTEWRQLDWRSYTAVQFPQFDLTQHVLPRTFDLIIAEQVFEHLRRPYSAARNVRSMLKPDGVFAIATPFLLRIHERPHDYTRWTPAGLAGFLEDCGFDPGKVRSWGNRKSVIANLYRWAEIGFGGKDMTNEDDFPVSVWAFARPA